MEIAIGIGIGIVIAALIARGKRGRNVALHSQPSTAAANETPSERKQRETDELITVILPTINND